MVKVETETAEAETAEVETGVGGGVEDREKEEVVTEAVGEETEVKREGEETLEMEEDVLAKRLHSMSNWVL